MEAIMSLGHWVSSSPGASKEVMIGFYLPITICTNWVTWSLGTQAMVLVLWGFNHGEYYTLV